MEEADSTRLSSGNASIGEKMAAFGVKGAMKIKRKSGMGLKKKTQPKTRKGGNLEKVRKISQKK